MAVTVIKKSLGYLKSVGDREYAFGGYIVAEVDGRPIIWQRWDEDTGETIIVPTHDSPADPDAVPVEITNEKAWVREHIINTARGYFTRVGGNTDRVSVKEQKRAAIVKASNVSGIGAIRTAFEADE